MRDWLAAVRVQRSTADTADIAETLLPLARGVVSAISAVSAGGPKIDGRGDVRSPAVVQATNSAPHLKVVSAVSAVSAAGCEIEERAAIAEYDGGLPRILAEALARLETCPPPPGTQPRRWQRAQAAFVELLATGAAIEALAAGWTPQELCGVSAIAPHDAPSKAGLIFSMWPGDRVEGVDRWGCNIAASQRWHTWRRVPASALAVMPWDLGT
jgi:hypothetical protein